MSYTYTDKKVGDLIRSSDWNDISRGVDELFKQKANKQGDPQQPFTTEALTANGPTTVVGALNVTGASTLADVTISGKLTVQNSTSQVIPSGVIVMWSGYKPNIPDGWAECNGQNSTPDLRSRFIVGAGAGSGLSNYDRGSTGGAETHTLKADEMPSHTHRFTIGQANDLNFSTVFGGPFVVGTDDIFAKVQHSTSSQGDGKAHENRPPYYALMFIMKL
jgi:microcystin-dependent protein